LTGTGLAGDHLFAFDRGGAVTVATRLPAGLAAVGGWRDTALELPAGSWIDALTGRAVPGGVTVVGELLDRYPVALLTREV
jgi:(1->4)-alpha-D-glucan 1-alpha-D-glucosylmutase